MTLRFDYNRKNSVNFQDVKAMICLSIYSKKINEHYIILYFNIKQYF